MLPLLVVLSVFYGQVSVVVAVRATPVAPVPVAAFADAIAWTVRVPAAPPGTHCAMPFWLMVAMEADCHPFCGEVRHRLPPARTDGDLQNRCRESLDRRCCRNPNPTGTKTKTEKPGLPEAPIAHVAAIRDVDRHLRSTVHVSALPDAIAPDSAPAW